jgi:tetratricopeptide (TPR) repeat protein
MYKKFDVDTTLAEPVKQLQLIVTDFSNTRAAFEARLTLGDLYYNHGQAEKSVKWYQEAADSAPGTFEKALAFYALGYSFENAAKPGEALKIYEKALNQGEVGLKGDLLLATARCYESMHDIAKARSTYDRIIAELPNTDYATSAQVFKAQIQ